MSELTKELKRMAEDMHKLGHKDDAWLLHDTIMLISTLQHTNAALKAKIDGGVRVGACKSPASGVTYVSTNVKQHTYNATLILDDGVEL